MHESDLFLIEMAAEGRGHTILTRALQLVPSTTKLLGDPRPTLTSFLSRKRRRKSFFSTFRLSPFTILMHPLLTWFIVASDDVSSHSKRGLWNAFTNIKCWFSFVGHSSEKVSLSPRKNPLENAWLPFNQGPDRAAWSRNSQHKIIQQWDYGLKEVFSLLGVKVSRDTFISHENANFLFSVFRVGQGESKTPKIIGCCRTNFAFLPALDICTFRGK